ncbi:MAG: tautomerase family protein [Nitrospirota bacterium]|nr:tautomerase family protein [Nitrospirota bacterium]
MPYLNIKISDQGSPEQTKQVADALASLTSSILRKKQELTSITVEYVDGSRWFVAGSPISSQGMKTFLLEINVTEGTNTKDEKAKYVKEVFSTMEALWGKLHPASYVIIRDIAADSWGYAGATQEFRYIKGKNL